MNATDIKDRTPNQNTIDDLERLLEEAKAGELRTFVYVAGYDDDSWLHGWSIDNRNTRRRLIGQMSMLQFDILSKQALDDGDSVLSKAIDSV